MNGRGRSLSGFAVGVAVSLALGVLALGGCRRPAERAAEKAVAELLPGYLGPADRYAVKVEGDSLGALMRGRVRRVRIDGVNVHLAREITVAELRIDADEIEVERSEKTLRSVGSARFRARIDGPEIDAFARRHRPRLVGVSVAMTGTNVRVKAVPEVFGYPTVPVTVDGFVEVAAGGAALDFTPDAARLAIVPIPKPVLDFVAERLNPVVDLRGANVPVKIESALVRDGALHLRGTIPPEEIVRRASGAAVAR